MGDTQASFSLSVRTRLRREYSNRCAICLLVLPDGGAQCAHLFDLSSRGANQVSMAQGYGIFPADFQRNSVRNGFLQCPLCHIAFFTPNHVALSPSVPVLNYINEYLANTEVDNQLPLHQVFRLLRNAATGAHARVTGLRIPTLYLPRVYSLQNGEFRPARTRNATSALIFDVVAAGNNTTVSHGHIPLSPEQDGFNTQRYWRLPIDTEIILAILIERTAALSPLLPQAQTTEIRLARTIFGRLLMQSNTGAGPFKTRERGEPPKKKPRMEKPDAPNEDLGLGFFIEEIDKRASDQSLVSSCERPHYGVDPKEWVVTTPFSTLTDGEPQANVYSGSSPSNRESDCGEDSSREWRFGPSFTSNRIIATARQIMNM